MIANGLLASVLLWFVLPLWLLAGVGAVTALGGTVAAVRT